MNDIIKAIKSEIDYCETTKLKVNPSYTPTEMARLDLVDKYIMSQYRDSDTDSFGNQMVFYNIVSLPVEVASKMLDFDTRDIKLIDELGSYWETWLMEKELHFWMKDKYFGRNLNEFAYRLPRDGHIIVKKVDDDVQVVPLKNLRFRPDALNLNETPIVEKYEYQYDQFISEAKKRGWDNYLQVKKQEDTTQVGDVEKVGRKVTIYEAWFPEGYLDTDDNWFLVSYDGIVLASGNKGISYKGLAWDKVVGRLLGRGQVEKLFNEQIYLNRIGNYKAEGLHWSSKHLFQTRDSSANTNLLGETENGEIFILNDPLTPVPVEERNLSFYNYEEQRWEKHSNDRTFTTDPVMGTRAPSGVPYSAQMLQAQMTQGYYDQKKEDLGMFVKEILWDWILPEFKKEKRKEHKVLMRNLLSSGTGSDKYFNMHMTAELNKEKMTKVMTPEVVEIRKAFIAEKLKGKKVQVPKGIYDDLKYKMDIVMDNENIDTAGKLQTLQMLLQMINSNPAIFQNKMTKDIIFKTLNLSGFNPGDFDFDDPVPSLQQAGAGAQMQRGGSIAAPQMPTQPQQVNTQTTV
jgi:hypothetical protein